MAATAQQRLQAVYANWCQALFLLDQAVAPGNTQAAIDAAVNSVTGLGVIVPKVTSSVDGESYDWTGLRATLVERMLDLEKAIQRAGGPYEVRTRGYT